MPRGTPSRYLRVHSWDPFHGDLNHRHHQLEAVHTRQMLRAQFEDQCLTQPAMHNNGIFGWIAREDAAEAMARRRGEKIDAAERSQASAERYVFIVDREAIAAAQRMQKEAA